MAKVLLILVCLIAGVASGIYFKSDDSSQGLETSTVSNDGTPSRVSNTEAQDGTQTPKSIVSEIKISNVELETIFKGVESEEMRTALKLSFSHPLDGKNSKDGYEASIQKLNQDPQKALNEISKLLVKMDTKNDGLRTHLLNLAMQTSADPNDKGEFIKDYLTQGSFNTDAQGLSDDSYSVVVAIDYLAQNFQKESEVQALVGEILSIENEKLKNEMKTRLAVHYPGII